jgi:hypothetical protein
MREVMVLPAVELHQTRPPSWQKNLTECEDFYCLSFLECKNPSTLCVLLPELPRMQNLQPCVCCYQSFLECKTFNLVCVLPPELPRMQNLQAQCVCVFHSGAESKIHVLRKMGVNGKKLDSCLQIYNGILWSIFRAIKQRCLCVSLPPIPFSLLFFDQLVINTQSKFAISPHSKAVACKWA